MPFSGEQELRNFLQRYLTRGPALHPATGRPAVPDYSQTSVMNPRYGSLQTQTLAPLIQELQRQQQFGSQFAQNPRQAIKATPEETQRMLKMAMAFGGADITKEQRDAWELENAQYRARPVRRDESGLTSWPESAGPESREAYAPGQRVKMRLMKWRRGLTGEYEMGGARGPETPEEREAVANWGAGEGTIVQPGTAAAGEPPRGEHGKQPPSDAWVAVRAEGAPNWHWRHRDALEILPPKEEFKIGDQVKYKPDPFESPNQYWKEGVIAKPPPNAPPSPGPDYVWADISKGKPVSRNIVRYKGGTWGGWFHKSAFEKKGK